VLLVRPSRIASGLRPFNTAAKEMHMNATHRPAARLADLSPFDITLETREGLPRVGNAVCGEFYQGGPESDSDYGCVDWYQYPLIQQSPTPQQSNLG
jgi:hypothetical protein